MTEEKHEDEMFENEPFETGEPVANGPAEPAGQEQPEPEAKGERPRDESGKFAKKAEEPPKPEGTVDVAPKQPEPGFVPFAAVLDERDKRKALEQQLEQFRAQQQPKDAPKPPDMFEDPEGWQAHQQQQFQQALYGQRLDISHRFAVQQHGKEAVEAAMEWGVERCSSDPHFNAMVQSQPDPVGFAVQQYQREQIASKVDLTEFEQFQAWKKAQAEAAPAQQSTPQQKPPPSIASAPSAGGVQHVAMGEEAVFDGEFQ